MGYRTKDGWADERYLEERVLASKLANGGLPRGSLRIAELKRGYSLLLPSAEWVRNIGIFGPVGAGKSKTFLRNMVRDIAAGGSAIIVDPKGELFEETARAFRKVYRLNLLDPSCSDLWNFMPRCANDPGFADAMARAIIGNSVEGFWREAELLLLKAVLLYLADRVSAPTPLMISYYLKGDYLKVRDLQDVGQEMIKAENPHITVAWWDFEGVVGELWESVATSLVYRMDRFGQAYAQQEIGGDSVTENGGDGAGGVRTNERVRREIRFEDLREGGTAIYVNVDEGEAIRYKDFLGAFIAQGVYELGRESNSAGRVPVAIVLDEAANVPLVGLREILSNTAGRRIGLILSYENVSGVHELYGEQVADKILSSIGTLLFLPGLDEVTCEFAARRARQPGSSEFRSAAEVRQLKEHRECMVVIDPLLPIKGGFLPYSQSRRKGILVEWVGKLVLGLYWWRLRRRQVRAARASSY